MPLFYMQASWLFGVLEDNLVLCVSVSSPRQCVVSANVCDNLASLDAQWWGGPFQFPLSNCEYFNTSSAVQKHLTSGSSLKCRLSQQFRVPNVTLQSLSEKKKQNICHYHHQPQRKVFCCCCWFLLFFFFKKSLKVLGRC